MQQEDDFLPPATAAAFLSALYPQRTTQQTLLAINLASQQKTFKNKKNTYLLK